MSDLRFGDERLPARFWAKVRVDEATGCWLWVGSVGGHGYGQIMFRPNKAPTTTHRLVAAAVLGDITGKFVCHTCDVRACVRPDHLFVGDAKANSLDMVAKGRGRNQNHGKTHCPQGHAYAGDNLVVFRGKRHCKACNVVGQRRYQARKRAANASSSTRR